jgi:hypothetical protein
MNSLRRISRALPLSPRRCRPMGGLQSQLGRLQPTPRDVEAIKRAGWRQHGILVVAMHDPRLSRSERELVRQLCDKLYSEQRSTPHG